MKNLMSIITKNYKIGVHFKLKKCLKLNFFTTKSASMDFSHSTSVAKIVSRGTTAVSEY